MRRSEWWAVRIGSIVGLFVLAAVLVAVTTAISGGDSDRGVDLATPLVIVLLVIMVWIDTAAMVKRLHDQDMTGWFALLVFVPLVGGLFAFIVMGCLDGTHGANKYGPSAKYPDTYRATVFD